MDILFKPIGHQKRRIPSALRPLFICDVPQKTDHVDSTFSHCFFGFIYRGRGYYEVDNARYEIEAPAVITEFPGARFRYGPESEWSELYIRFDPDCFKDLETRGIWSRSKPCYPIENSQSWTELLKVVQQKLKHSDVQHNPDVFDRLIELLILESLPLNPELGSISKDDPSVQAIKQLQKHILNNLAFAYDWSTCAHELGMSLSSFRRHWLSTVGIPPARYVMEKRLERSSTLLLATALPIKEVAQAVGFDDPLHFSRKFKEHFKLSPRAFRRVNSG